MKKILLFLVTALLITSFASCNTQSNIVEPDGSDTEITTQKPTEKPTEKPTSKPEPTKPEDFDDKGNVTLDGWSDYVIVTGEDASKSETTAAKQLQTYLKKISGATIKIVTDKKAEQEKEIVVGKTNRESENEFDRNELGDEGFVIKTRDKKIFIVGGELRGTLYGVYTYLENYLGCRFYTNDFEKIPTIDPLPFIEIEEDKQIPIFETRNPGWVDSYDHDFSAKLKINGSHGRGTTSATFGSNPTWAGSPCHTLYDLAEMSGKSFNNEPCLSDENVYQTVLKNVKKILEANPNASYISVSQNDSDTNDRACKCEKCNEVYRRTGSRSGIYLTFVNRIAEEIKDEYPNVMIHTFAYKFTKDVPVGVIPADNVMVQFCTIEACFRHPLAECTHSVYSSSTDFEKLVKDWAEICNYLAVWDYTTNFSYYNMSFPNFDAMYDNIRLFADNNVKYVYEQGNFQSTNGEFSELRSYLLARLLWDPYMTREEYYAYMDEFLLDYYGEGGPKIREYIDLILDETKDAHVGIYDAPSKLYPNSVNVIRESGIPTNITAENLRNFRTVDWTPYYEWYASYDQNKVLSEGKKLFEEALSLASTDEQKKHVEKSSLQITCLESYYLYGRMEAIRQNIYKLAYDLTKELNSGDDSECSFVATAISNYVFADLKAEYIEFNKLYLKKLSSFNIKYEAETFPISPDGQYDFSTTPNKW